MVSTTGQVYLFGPRTQTITSPTFSVKTGGDGSYGNINVQVTNQCGQVTGGTAVDQRYCQSYRTTLYPNPASDEVQVQQIAPNEAKAARSTDVASEQPDSKGISAVRIYDSYGQLRLEQAGKGAKSVRLWVAPLPAGLYIVHVLQGDAVVNRQQLQISR